MGDPAGIGPEIVVKALMNSKVGKTSIPLVFGSFEVIKRAALSFAKKAKVKKVETFYNLENQPGVINVLNCTDLDYKKIKPGKLSVASGKMAAESLICATLNAIFKKIDGIVTAPLAKKGLFLAGYNFKGHTDFLAKLSSTKKYAMVFVTPKLKLVLVTTHIPLSEVSKKLTKEKIEEKIKLADELLRKAFKIKNPKIGICALNPHSGEEGLLGKEEQKIILPAMKKAQRGKIKVFGPYPADSIFSPSVSKNFDCIVAMYHDQGLISLKTKGIGNAVNLTWGLPFVRTSPDHGTAFDIAGKGIADPKGMVNAILLASKLAKMGMGVKDELAKN
jgi:4-phospho-D-threonate 3-dehydrogenase / 4-phospho-D-erythronate 3-dehydrogenase